MSKLNRRTVMIVEDHALYRMGLRELLEADYEVVAEAVEGHEAVNSAMKWQPDVVTMDISMPGMDGLAATRLMKSRLPNTAVVMISSRSDQVSVVDSIEAGATSYVLKDDPPDELLSAIRAAAEGAVYLPPSVTGPLLNHLAGTMNGERQPASTQTKLSARETEVLRLIGVGHSNREIAGLLSVSVRTVGSHVASMYRKLGMVNRSQVIRYAITKGLVNVHPQEPRR